MSAQESKTKKKRPRDLNKLAFGLVDEITREGSATLFAVTVLKNPAAVELGRLGGIKGGKARAEKLTAERRSEIARKAALERWRKAKSKGSDDKS